jgi:hypothetical protein
VDHSRGEVLVTAVSRLDGCKAEISIRGGPPSWKREAPLLHIPTRDGFSNNPGCRETYVLCSMFFLSCLVCDLSVSLLPVY